MEGNATYSGGGAPETVAAAVLGPAVCGLEAHGHTFPEADLSIRGFRWERGPTLRADHKNSPWS